MSDQTAQTARADVIHDIGYRHYVGPRLGPGYATRSLFLMTLRGSFGIGRSVKSKILPFGVLALMVLPAAAMVAISVYLKRGALPVDYAPYLSDFFVVIAVFTAAQAPVALSRDLRFQSMPLYFSRPITAGDYVRAKFAAMAASLFVITAAPVLILWLGALLASMDFRYNLEHMGMGLVTAALYSLVFSAVSLVIASVTPRRGFGVAGIIAVLMITSGLAAIGYHLIQNRGQSGAGWAMLISPSELVNTVSAWMFSLPLDPDALRVPSDLGGVVFLLELALIVAAAYGFLVRRYRKI